MANIVEMYSNQYDSEFRNILKRITDAILETTESIPKDKALKNITRNRFWNFAGNNFFEVKENCLWIWCDDGSEPIGEYPYDDTAEKELDMFLKQHFPCINCDCFYILDLYERTIEMCFIYNPKIEEDDFESDLRLKTDRREKDKEWVISSFNDHVKEALGIDLKYDDWAKSYFVSLKKGTLLCETSVIIEGTLSLKFPIG